jgi:hypothetical protein
MSTNALPAPATPSGDGALVGEVLSHLEAQVQSVRGLLQVVLDQGAAIRARNVQAVVTLTGVLQGEMQRRKTIEHARLLLLHRAGQRLGVSAAQVTLIDLCALMDCATAELVQNRSAELRGLLEVVQREHHVNRALMSQELAFLDHLLRLSGAGDTAYDAAGDRATVRASAPGRHRMLDVAV